jgi:hypothetical protein
VKARGADEGEDKQRYASESQIANGLHDGLWLLVVGLRPLARLFRSWVGFG